MSIKQREKQMREENPWMFEHPELRSGEVWLDELVADAARLSVAMYHSDGVKSARIGNPVFKHGNRSEFHSVFAKLEEMIAYYEEESENENPATEKSLILSK